MTVLELCVWLSASHPPPPLPLACPTNQPTDNLHTFDICILQGYKDVKKKKPFFIKIFGLCMMVFSCYPFFNYALFYIDSCDCGFFYTECSCLENV